MRPLDTIYVHCTATRPDWWSGASNAAQIAEIRRWHVDPVPKGRGWSDIGYHYLITRDGKLHTGRPLERVGAHVAGHNTGSIGISLFGGHGGAETDRPEDHFTPAQMVTLRKTILDLQKTYPTIKNIMGHNQSAAKACPCFHVPTWWAGVSKEAVTVDAPAPKAKFGLWKFLTGKPSPKYLGGER